MYKPNTHRTAAATAQRKKQLITLTLFLCSFLFASWYAPEIENPHPTPPANVR